MKRYFALAISLISTTAFSQEPPFIHGEFGFAPSGWKGPELTATQKIDLDNCVLAATKQANMSKEDLAALNSLYGFKASGKDFYGATLSGCLADQKDGKGWSVTKRSGQAWESVTSRYAVRTFMGLDPNK